MKQRVTMITLAGLAACGSVALAAPPAPPPEYTLVELQGVSGRLANPYHCSESRSILRVVGYVDGGTWINEGGGQCSTKSVPAYWDVAGTASPVAPVLLPLARPDKPGHVWDSSRDGGSLAGSAWDGDDGTCGYTSRPAIWEQGPVGWTVTYLPIPSGYVHGSTKAIKDGATMVFGTVNWPELLPGGSTRVVARACIWRRNPDGVSFSTEILTNTCWGCDSLVSFWGGLRHSGMVAAAGVWESMDDPSGARMPRYWEDVGGAWVEHDLPLLSNASYGWAETGDSVMFHGVSRLSATSGNQHAVVWETSSSAARDLGSLDGASGDSFAFDQNGTGLTVGYSTKASSRGATENRAVRWTPPSWALVDLNTKASTNGWLLEYARGVDASGRIAGRMHKTIRGNYAEIGFALIPLN